MASSAPIRLPLRMLTRPAKANQFLSSHHLRARQPATPLRPVFTCRYNSDVTNPPPESAETKTVAETEVPIPSETKTKVTVTSPAQVTGENAADDKGTKLDFRLPRTEYGVPSCDLQLRSYSVRNLEFFSDFALRAAYYLGLPAFGPVPLPRIVERWTVPRSSFVFKKSQENFERKTLRRLIQIKDGNPETVEVWLAFLRKHAYYGIGMKANVFAFEKLEVGKAMDLEMEKMRETIDATLDQIAVKKGPKGGLEGAKILELINREDFRAASHGNAPMVKAPKPFT
ncbi:ribosomal protein S10 domain-containing protein [Halenospora varia]|nr:ribosomal protein S10 domain-containing protein [Halenospora varia]